MGDAIHWAAPRSKASSKRAVVNNFTQAHALPGQRRGRPMGRAGPGQHQPQRGHHGWDGGALQQLTAHAFHVDGSGNGVGPARPSAAPTIRRWLMAARSSCSTTRTPAFSVDDSGNGAWTVQPLGGTSHSTATTQ